MGSGIRSAAGFRALLQNPWYRGDRRETIAPGSGAGMGAGSAQGSSFLLTNRHPVWCRRIWKLLSLLLCAKNQLLAGEACFFWLAGRVNGFSWVESRGCMSHLQMRRSLWPPWTHHASREPAVPTFTWSASGSHQSSLLGMPTVTSGRTELS